MRRLLLIEAALLSFPITVVLVGTLPILLIGIAVAVTTPSFEATWLAVQALCSLFALFQYWRLVAKTVRGEQIQPGLVGWFAVACALVAAFFFITYLNVSIAAVLSVLAIFASTVHFIAIQRSMGRASGLAET